MNSKVYVIQSSEIGLRLVKDKDRERFFFIEQDVEINQYIKLPTSLEETEAFFQKFKHDWSQVEGEWYGFAIANADDDEFMGMAFFQYRDKSSEIIEIGWKLHPDFEGRGFATQAAKLLMKYLVENFTVHKMVAHCRASHGASERIMQKLGMQKEGFFKSNFKIGDQWYDELAYGLVCERKG